MVDIWSHSIHYSGFHWVTLNYGFLFTSCANLPIKTLKNPIVTKNMAEQI